MVFHYFLFFCVDQYLRCEYVSFRITPVILFKKTDLTLSTCCLVGKYISVERGKSCLFIVISCTVFQAYCNNMFLACIKNIMHQRIALDIFLKMSNLANMLQLKKNWAFIGKWVLLETKDMHWISIEHRIKNAESFLKVYFKC